MKKKKSKQQRKQMDIHKVVVQTKINFNNTNIYNKTKTNDKLKYIGINPE